MKIMEEMSRSQSESDSVGVSLVKREVRKMAGETSTGKCHLCGGTFDKSEMTKHLKSCKQKEGPESASSGRGSQKKDVFHLLVEGRHSPEYWMHIELAADAGLKVLDNFLRDTWLECCGHLSMFSIQGKNYSVADMGEFDDETMDARLGDVLSPGMKFSHEYDFGSTTHLTLKVISQEQKQVKGKDARILARNDPPSFACVSCGKPATQICTECVCSDEGCLCEKCAAEHACGEEMLLPLVNSPRAGVCGYTGD